MERRVVVGLIAVLAIACGEPNDMQSGGTGGRSPLDGISNLSGQVGGDGDGDGDGDAPDSGADGGEHSDPDGGMHEQPDSSTADASDETPDSGPAPCDDEDRDDICDDVDECIAPNAAPDDDFDGVPNVCDDCPVGAPSACDVLLWELERLNVQYSDESVVGFYSQLVLSPNGGGSAFWAGRPLGAAETTQELDADELAEAQAFFDKEDGDFVATVQFSEELYQGVILGEPWLGPIVPYGIAAGRVHVKRIVVTGRATASGNASATWQIRGYLRPF